MGKLSEKDSTNKKWYRKLKNKYRLVILNDETYEERLSFRLTRLNVFVLLGTISIILIVLTTVIIAFTPLREYIPGYMDTRIPKMVYQLQRKTDSLERIVTQKNVYLTTIKNIIAGNDFGDTIVEQPNAALNYDTITMDISPQDSLFRVEYEQQNQYNLYMYENHSTGEINPSAEFNFFTPLKGSITNHFNLIDKHYGVDVVSSQNETVKATLDGTVIFSDWTLNTGYVIGIQHQGNYISVYKHNSTLLKKVGSFVKAGEPIAIVGETGELSTGPHLHFELWHNGTPINPLENVAF